MYNDIERLEKEILENHNLVRRIDFRHDVDMKKSDRFVLNLNQGYLKFLFGEKEHITGQDYKIVFGGLEETESGIKPVLSLNEEFGDMSYVSTSLQIAKALDNISADIIFLSFSHRADADFYIRLCSKYFDETIARVIRKELNYNAKQFDDSRNKSVDFIFRDKTLSIYKRTASKLDANGSARLSLKDNSVDLIINRKKKCALVNGQLIRIPILDYMEDNQIYINIISFAKKELNLSKAATIESFLFGTEEGYIYLNPIELHKDGVQISMIYGGRPTVEYHSEKLDQWIRIMENQTINISKNLRLRIKAKMGERIYRLFVCESTQKR